MKTVMELSDMNRADNLIDYCEKNQDAFYVFEAVINLVDDKDGKFVIISKVDGKFVTIINDGGEKRVMSIGNDIDTAILEMRFYVGLVVNDYLENGDETIPYYFAKVDELKLEDETTTYYIAKMSKKEIKKIKKYFKKIG